MAIQYQYLEQVKGVTMIGGHRIRVLDIDDRRKTGLTPEELANGYEIPLGAVYEAIAYAENHKAEIATLRLDEESALARVQSRAK
ncbi:MAG: DUF433 domain-containing protein [Chloroflexota bacterium]